jgi:hypothetical protein
MSLVHTLAVFNNNNLGINAPETAVDLTFQDEVFGFAISPNDASSSITFDRSGEVRVRRNNELVQTTTWLNNISDLDPSEYKLRVSASGSALSNGSAPLDTDLNLDSIYSYGIITEGNGFQSKQTTLTCTVTNISNPSDTDTRDIILRAETET